MNLIISILLIIIGQTLTYFQTQSQFFWPWAKEHPLLMSLLGIPMSIMFIYFAKYNALAFEGQTWPGRVIQFCVGTIVFAILSSVITGEVITMKTGVSLGLAILILVIQILWK